MNRRIAAIMSLDVVGYSALMAKDAKSALAELNRVLNAVVRTAVTEHTGRIFKLMGDGALAEFSSASAAILCANQIQQALIGDPIQLRAGVHVGDVIDDGKDVFGDAVIVAARLQSAAPSGGAFVSGTALNLAGGGLEIGFRPEGLHHFKNVPVPIEVMSIDFSRAERQERYAEFADSQEIRFTSSSDGVRLAWSKVGAGKPIVKAPNWIHHLELDWEMYYAGMLGAVASRYQLIRFDSRGNGLSDWDVPEISLDLFVDDLRAVFDAADIERAPIFSLSQGCAVAASFAVKYPERVAGLCFLGSFAQGPAKRSNPPQAGTSAAIQQLAGAGWEDDYPSVRDHVAQLVIPDASLDDQRQFAELMKDIISPENFIRFRAAVDSIDVVDLLPQIHCPTLVMHGRDDRLHPIDQGRMMAAGIPGARFIAIPTRNHLFPDYDPAWPFVEKELVDFLASV